jgi:hypothetical protein
MAIFSKRIRLILFNFILLTALFTNPKTANSGYWVCTYNIVGNNSKRNLIHSKENIALMYLGYKKYYNGKIIKVHLRDNYDYLSSTMFTSIGLNYNIYEYLFKYSYTVNDNNRSNPTFVKNDLDMVITMKNNAPAIGYVDNILPIYNVSQCSAN